MNKGKHFHFFLTLFFFLLSNILTLSNANDQVTNLFKMLNSRRSKDPSQAAPWAALPAQIKGARVHVGPQNGLMEADKITTLPGQPNGVDFDQYSGYVTVNPAEEKALFYYFAESPKDASSKPLVLWLNGGPGCSSFGNGGLLELGPFRVQSDGKTLSRNPYAWNNVANVLFLESPAGVGFSYGKESIYNQTGDMSTANDAYTFLVNWFERFPQYKNRDFYLAGESYAGHYVPQLAYTILHNNKNSKHGFINLRGIAIGNAWIDDTTNQAGMFNYLWTHAMFSDETYTKIRKFCNFSATFTSDECNEAQNIAGDEMGGNIDIYNIYAPVCQTSGNKKAQILDSVEVFDPCSSTYVASYLNTKKVQKALHVKPTKWQSCSEFDWQDSPSTILPVIKQLMDSNISVWIYSGDVDGRVPITSTRYSIKTFKLPITTAWRPWYTHDQVGGYVVSYGGLVFVTVRGAGHLVPSYQPQRALTLVSSFLQGTLPPRS